MKKIFFTLLALVGTMSMNAQVVKLYKGDVLVTSYDASQVDNVVFEEAPAATTGTAKATIGSSEVDVNWVQLWDGGPKFAEYNIGATSATENGGYYAWGGTYMNGIGITWYEDPNTGNAVLTGNDDTATALWGSKWRMPTKEEFDNLLKNCTVEWIDGDTKKYNNTDVKGLLCTGKGDYKDNSVFLPAAGFCKDGDGSGQGRKGCYYSSTPYDSKYAYNLSFIISNTQSVDFDIRYNGYSVRAVLK